MGSPPNLIPDRYRSSAIKRCRSGHESVESGRRRSTPGNPLAYLSHRQIVIHPAVHIDLNGSIHHRFCKHLPLVTQLHLPIREVWKTGFCHVLNQKQLNNFASLRGTSCGPRMLLTLVLGHVWDSGSFCLCLNWVLTCLNHILKVLAMHFICLVTLGKL